MQKSIIQKLTFLVLLCCLFCSTDYLRAHKYYFAYAEVEYNEQSSKLEATLILTAHDFEEYLLSHKITSLSIEKSLKDSTQQKKIMVEILNHFKFYSDFKDESMNEEPYQFQFEGFNLRLDGNIEIYMSADIVKPEMMLTVVFDLLMNDFPEQQNKVTFISRKKKQTLNFTSNKKFQLIDLY